MSKAVRVAFIGGASMTWMPSFAADFLRYKPLWGSTLVLMDTNVKALSTMMRYVQRMKTEMGGDINFESTTDRQKALDGADFVIITFMAGGHQYWKEDVGIALKHGLMEPAGMSVGPGGLMQGLQAIPMIVEIAQEMEEICPGAMMLNYTNPMSSITLGVQRYSSIPMAGVCPGIYGYLGRIGEALGVAPESMRCRAAGVNHMNWIVSLEADSRDLLKEWCAYTATHSRKASSSYESKYAAAFAQGMDVVSRTLYELYDAWPIPGDGHTSEFMPYFIRKGVDVGKYGLKHDYIEERIEKRKGVWANIERAAAGEGPLLMGGYESVEKAEQMIGSIVHNESRSFTLNVMNNGTISNVVPEAAVEVSVACDAFGFHPIRFGELPPAIAAWTNLYAAVQDLTVEAAMRGDRKLALQALLMDPLMYSFDISEASDMLDEMLMASKPVLPRFFEA
ncbi:MAG: family 4 glycosyl hydrolase [Anaerolineae bacterium]